MLPNRPMQGPPMGGPGVGGPPVPPGAEGGGPGEANPETVKRQLVMLLTQAKKVAEHNGVNFSEVLSEVEGNKVKSDVPLPRPPSPPMP